MRCHTSLVVRPGSVRVLKGILFFFLGPFASAPLGSEPSSNLRPVSFVPGTKVAEVAVAKPLDKMQN